MNPRIAPFLARILLAAAAACVAPVRAQDPAADYPAKPIRILVGFTPGGGPDITARYIAQKLTDAWKQQVIVDNRPGAGGRASEPRRLHAALRIFRARRRGRDLFEASLRRFEGPLRHHRDRGLELRA